MMLNISLEKDMEHNWLKPQMWIVPTILAVILFFDFIYVKNYEASGDNRQIIPPKEVGISLFTTLPFRSGNCSHAFIGSIIGAYHLGRQKKAGHSSFLVKKEYLPIEETEI